MLHTQTGDRRRDGRSAPGGAQGVENQEITHARNYSVYTVANRLRTIYQKLHVTNRTQAALYALRQGWVALDEPPG